MRVFPNEISIKVFLINKIICSLKCGWPSSNLLRAYIEQKVGRIHPFLHNCLSWDIDLVLPLLLLLVLRLSDLD